jgi:hypothetical protein
MKKINIIYWVSTILFGGFMFMTAIPNVMVDQGSVDLITTQLGYPRYIIPYLGIAKVLGSIVLFIPGFPRLKEWAYAGLIFDLTGAVYSGIAVNGFDPMMLTLLPLYVAAALSYIYHHKRLAASGQVSAV